MTDAATHEEEDRSVSVTAAVRGRHLTADERPLARKKAGEQTETTYVGGGIHSDEATSLGGGCQSAKTYRKDDVCDPVKFEKWTAKQAKGRRQRESRSAEGQANIDTNKFQREYSFYLRVAAASTVLCPVEYYSAPGKMWTPPELGKPYTLEEVCGLYPCNEARDKPVGSMKQSLSLIHI